MSIPGLLCFFEQLPGVVLHLCPLSEPGLVRGDTLHDLREPVERIPECLDLESHDACLLVVARHQVVRQIRVQVTDPMFNQQAQHPPPRMGQQLQQVADLLRAEAVPIGRPVKFQGL